MSKWSFLCCLFILCLSMGCSRPGDSLLDQHSSGNTPAGLTGEWIDLSHDFSSETVYWPTADTFNLETVANGVTDKGFYYSANKFCAAEHGGTHVDAPTHFAKDHQSVDQIPLDHLIGQA